MWAVAISGFIDQSVQPRVRRKLGEMLWIEEEDKMDRWEEARLIRRLRTTFEPSEEWPWGGVGGLDLDPFERPGEWKRVVACLNIWQDLPDLKATYESWYPFVDHVIAVDGAYATARDVGAVEAWSIDGTRDFLKGLDKVELIGCKQFGWWPDQMVKRSRYFEAAEEGDLLFIVDADEWVINGEALRSVPDLDVGWVHYYNPIYKRPQGFPRLFRARPGLHYAGRHHWIWTAGEDLITTCQRGGYAKHKRVEIGMVNHRGFARRAGRNEIDLMQRSRQASKEQKVDMAKQVGGHEPLRVLQLATLDAGMVCYRLHSAINTTTPHESLMATADHDRPYQEPWQYDLRDQGDQVLLRKAMEHADVIHCHLHYHEALKLGAYTAPVVIHHHGTMFRSSPDFRNEEDGRRAKVRLVSNLELLQYGTDLHWLPNPVPVATYQELRTSSWTDSQFRVAHSPSKRELKGTDDFLWAVEQLQGEGLPIEPVLIEGQTHAESIRIKGTCHAVFDSFFLGLQCSGLEAAAMGLPVVAGDAHVRDQYVKMLGQVPYTYAPDRETLKVALCNLATDADFWHEEAHRVSLYTLEYHDYGAVAARYLEILDAILNWRLKLSLGLFSGPLRG